MHLRFILYFTLIATILTSCEHETDELYFIGDSIIARWDLSASFPASVTHNMGVSGSGIDYLEGLQGTMADKTVVVVSGTNNVTMMREDMDGYVDRYVRAVEALGAERVYLVSVLPRAFVHDRPDFNQLISEFNSRVHSNIWPGVVYVDVYTAFERDGTVNRQYTHDGLHPNDYGYEVMAKAIIKARK